MTHYSRAQKPHQLWPNALSLAAAVIKEFKKKKAIPVLSYQGFSGAASATALMLAIRQLDNEFPFIMCYVRKEEEKKNHSGGNNHEWEPVGILPDWPWVGLFVDDLISTGETFRQVAKVAKDLRTSYEHTGVQRKTVIWDENTLMAGLNYPDEGLKNIGKTWRRR